MDITSLDFGDRLACAPGALFNDLFHPVPENRARRNGVHPDIVRTHFRCKRARQRDQPRFGNRVGRPQGIGALAGHRSYVNDLSTPFFIIPGKTALQHKNGPVRLTPISSVHDCGFSSATGAVAPRTEALLIKTSIRPKLFSEASIASLT